MQIPRLPAVRAHKSTIIVMNSDLNSTGAASAPAVQSAPAPVPATVAAPAPLSAPVAAQTGAPRPKNQKSRFNKKAVTS